MTAKTNTKEIKTCENEYQGIWKQAESETKQNEWGEKMKYGNYNWGKKRLEGGISTN